MPHTSLITRTLIVLLVGALAACASAPRGEPGEAVLVKVNNNLIPPTSLSVYMDPEVGARRLLGHVSPGSSTTLRYTGIAVGSNYRLVARTTGGADIPSTPFPLVRGGTVTWDVQSRIATVSTDDTP